MEINLRHKEQTDEEAYINLKKNNKKYPGTFMDANEWKRRRKKVLNKEGKNWSK